MTTASRPGSGALSTQFTHAVERYKKEVVDISRKESVVLRLAERLGFKRVMQTGMAEINPVLDTKDVPVTGFTTGFETLPTSAVQGAHAFYVEYANMAAPVAVSWVEERKLDTPQKMIDLVKTRLYKAGVAINQRAETAFFKGNASDASMPVGLEQLVFAKGQVTAVTAALFAVAPRWQLRQANNTVHGWTRTAFTADDVGGTHFENLSADVDDGGGFWTTALSWAITPGVTSGLPLSDGGRVFNRFYNACSVGNDHPDLIISDYGTLEEYQNATAGLVRYAVGGMGASGAKAELGIPSATYQGAEWHASEECTHSGLGSATASAGDRLIYFLNTKWMEYQVDSQGDYAVTEWGTAPGQLAAAQQVVLRSQLVINNPRTCGVLSGWGL